MGRPEPPVRYDEIAPRAPDGPIDLSSLAPGGGPIELDIGFGRGRSLFERAEAAPEARIVGVELKAKWAWRVEQRRRRLGLDRVVVFAGDARDLLDRAGPDGSVARVFVHFPDPWWKKRHAKRRVLGPSFLDTLARLLEPGGALYVQTDVEARALLYRDLIAAHADFALDGGRGWVEANPFGARSNREARADEDGLPVYRLLAHRLPLGPPAP
ncbi:MAG: tRNA (guanosine(46)-N7)-methyltransferase TrmB [Myxococcales bacterium]|nr:tRNA (guanosine(46)-N7)-methyltransferase TrmB [Myxococcales bacterium]